MTKVKQAVVQEEQMLRCSFCDGEIKNECDSCGSELTYQEEFGEKESCGDMPYTGQTFWCVTNVGHHCGDCIAPAHNEDAED